MSNPLRNRWLRWSLFVAALVALGVGIYQIQPPEPMCEIEVPPTYFEFVGGGDTLATLPWADWNTWIKTECPSTPLKLWDTRTGKEVASYLEDGRHYSTCSLSRCGRYLATEILTIDRTDNQAQPMASALVMLEIGKGVIWEKPLHGFQSDLGYRFSPSGDYVQRPTAVEGDVRESIVYETRTGRIVLRHSGWCTGLSDDGVLLRGPDEEDENNLEIWSLRQNKSVAKLNGAYIQGGGGPDHRLLIIQRVAKERTKGSYEIWNLEALRKELEFEIEPRDPDDAELIPCVSDDGRWLARGMASDHGGYIEVREIATGVRIAKQPIVGWQAPMLSPDGRFLLTQSSRDDPTNPNPTKKPCTYTMFDASSLGVLWKATLNINPFVTRCGDFSHHSRTLFVSSLDAPEVLGFDCETGIVRDRVSLATDQLIIQHRQEKSRRLIISQEDGRPFRQSWFERLPWLGQFFRHPSGTIVVLDTDSCRERFRLRGVESPWPQLSEDGRTLVTANEVSANAYILRCWDVDAIKPLRYAIAIPAAFGVAVLLIWKWRHRRAIQHREGEAPAEPGTREELVAPTARQEARPPVNSADTP